MSTEQGRVDVLIITAAEGEDDAVREVNDGAVGSWTDETPPEFGFRVWRQEYATDRGKPLRVVMTRAPYLGAEAAGNVAAQLVPVYRPTCLAMCGVCAGRPEWTHLGDVIVADRLWRYDAGEQVNTERGGTAQFFADTLTYPFDAQWKQLAEAYRVPPDTPWLNDRPRTRELQADWILNELLEERDPLASPQRTTRCADWTEVVRDLRKRKYITLKGQTPRLTAEGRKHIEQVLFENAKALPEPPAWRIHVGPLGTGNNLVRDVDIWDRIAETQRLVRGLDMEASVIGLTAHVQRVSQMIVVKGVMDYAEPDRNYGFRPFAARAAAEVLIGFLRAHLEPAARRTPANVFRRDVEPPTPLTNPAALLDSRYEVVPFFEEVRRHELETLQGWIEDPRPTSVRLFTGPGGAGKTRLFIEWTKRLRDRGLDAGFLPDRIEDDDI